MGRLLRTQLESFAVEPRKLRTAVVWTVLSKQSLLRTWFRRSSNPILLAIDNPAVHDATVAENLGPLPFCEISRISNSCRVVSCASSFCEYKKSYMA
jgi:hypothetical protein